MIQVEGFLCIILAKYTCDKSRVSDEIRSEGYKTIISVFCIEITRIAKRIAPSLFNISETKNCIE